MATSTSRPRGARAAKVTQKTRPVKGAQKPEPETPRITPTQLAAVRIGIHTSVRGGLEQAAERAYRLGCAAFQIFSSSPRQWRPWELSPNTCQQMKCLRERYALSPLVIHDSYLINLAASDPVVHARSREAFRAEIDRALLLGADYLVMHPGTSSLPRERALDNLAAAIRECAAGVDWNGLTLLIENTGGGSTRLGGSFGELAQLLQRLAGLPVGVCIDTCHCWIAGYDIVSPSGYEETIRELDAEIGLQRVRVIHTNDTDSRRGSHWDRHQHIGEGKLGLQTFKRWLNDPRMAGKAFILETPLDEEGDDQRNVQVLIALVEGSPARVESAAVTKLQRRLSARGR